MTVSTTAPRCAHYRGACSYCMSRALCGAAGTKPTGEFRCTWCPGSPTSLTPRSRAKPPLCGREKRTASAATAVFYRPNRYHLSVRDPGTEVGLVVDVAEGFLDVAAIEGKLKTWAVPFDLEDDD
jgi:hypothetical protein